MIDLTSRQNLILKHLIEEYVLTAEPVSSSLLCEKFDFEVSPATIRIELGRISDEGYLFQPHTSAGRVPTDKGYRFFVDRLNGNRVNGAELDRIKDFLQKDIWQKVPELSRFVAEATSLFALSGVPAQRFFFGTGWSQVLEEPEFKQREVPISFARLVREMEKDIRTWQGERDVEVFIGKENPFGSFQEFSVVIARCAFKEGKGVVVVAGPKRMAYSKNVGLLRRIKNWVEKKI